MLATRIIPTILCRGRQLVKGKRFNSSRVVGLAEQAARIYASREVDELCILDVSATAEGRGPDLEMIQSLTDDIFSPIAVGGGVKSLEDVRELLNSGADKVCIGTAALLDHDLVKKVSKLFGSQAIIVSIDADEFYKPNFNSGKDSNGYGLSVIDYAQDCECRGAGEILLQDIYRDGTMDGYNIELIRSVTKSVSIPVIASGGCKDYEDMYNAIKAGASAVAAGALFQFTDATPRGAAEYLQSRGVEVRIPDRAVA